MLTLSITIRICNRIFTGFQLFEVHVLFGILEIPDNGACRTRGVERGT
jgi:hypothetical protein